MTSTPNEATNIGPEELTALVNLAGSLYEESSLTAKVGAWRSAVILIGASIEAALLGTVVCMEPELRVAQLWPAGKRPLTELGLAELVGIATSAGWLPTSTTDRRASADPGTLVEGDVSDAVDFVRLLRNVLAHPGRHLSDFPWLDAASGEVMRPTYELCEGIAGEVFTRLRDVINGISVDGYG